MPAKDPGVRSRKTASAARSRAQEPSDNAVSLSRESIAKGAVELLDAEGIDGLTMRRLAEHLGSGVMSLYWHVDSKNDVLAVALDAVLAYASPKQSPSSTWRDDVVQMLEDWRGAMLRHSWSAALLQRLALGPNALLRIELLSQTLSRAGVPDATLNFAIWSLYNHVMGATIARTSFDLSQGDRAAKQQHSTPAGRYPTIERSRLLHDDDWDGAFRKGVGFLLDGISPTRG